MVLLYYAQVMQNAFEMTIGQASFIIPLGFYYHVVNQEISNDRSVRILYRPRMLIALFCFEKYKYFYACLIC